MSVPAVPKEVDSTLFHQLEHRSSSVLCRVFNHYYHTDESDYLDAAEFDQEGWRRLLSGEIPEETRSWLQTHMRLSEESVSRVHGAAYLNENYGVQEPKRDPDSLYEIAILLHELGFEDDLSEFIVSTRVRQNEMKRTWVLNQQVSLADISNKIESFHSDWNQREGREKAVLIEEELSGDGVVALQFYAEKGAGVTEKETFAFRENDRSDIPTQPELSKVQYRDLKQIRVFLKVESDQTLIVFTQDYSLGWNGILDGFFDHTFGVQDVTDVIEQQRVTDATELQEDANESLELEDKPLEQVTGMIDNRSEAALEAVEESYHGPKRTEQIKQKLQTIELSGSEIEDDPNLGTEEFRLIGRTNLDEVFDQVDFEDSFLQFLQRASEESLALVLNVDGRHVAARETGPQAVDGSRLGAEAQLALEYFFERERVV